eukprot:7876106-Pyramimonas_sp.AAC.1
MPRPSGCPSEACATSCVLILISGTGRSDHQCLVGSCAACPFSCLRRCSSRTWGPSVKGWDGGALALQDWGRAGDEVALRKGSVNRGCTSY